MTKEEFAKAEYARRVEMEISKTNLAKKAKVNRSCIVKIEAGYPVRDYTVAKVCKALGMRIPKIED